MVQTLAPEARGVRINFPSAAIIALGLTIVVVLSTAIADVRPARAAELTELKIWDGAAKPAFVLDDIERRSISLAGGEPVTTLVHFFATWCEPCRDEIPALRRLVARTDVAHVRVLTISVGEVDARVRSFIDKFPVNFPVLLDRDRSVARAWNVSSLPTTFILDRNLQPRLFVERDYDWDKFDVSAFLKTLSAKQPATIETQQLASQGDKQ